MQIIIKKKAACSFKIKTASMHTTKFHGIQNLRANKINLFLKVY